MSQTNVEVYKNTYIENRKLEWLLHNGKIRESVYFRGAIGDRIDALLSEFDEIHDQTKYNGFQLFADDDNNAVKILSLGFLLYFAFNCCFISCNFILRTLSLTLVLSIITFEFGSVLPIIKCP